ncbi:MAG: L,D-transpeptidase family protein [Methylococcus sp.]
MVGRSFFLLFLCVWVNGSLLAAETGFQAEFSKWLTLGRIPGLRYESLLDVAKPLASIYSAASPQPVWLRDGRPSAQATSMVEMLGRSEDLGLRREDYDLPFLQDRLRMFSQGPLAVQEASRFDLVLTVSSLRFLRHVSVGHVQPRAVGFNIEPRRIDGAFELRRIFLGESPRKVVMELEPNFPIYKPLKEALKRYRLLARELPRPRFGFPLLFRPGMQHQDVPALRKLLTALGDLPSFTAKDQRAELYDPVLAGAVKAFQMRHGILDDGVIGQATLKRLSTPIADRLKQIELGLERLRWLPADIKGYYLIVNIPAFKLYGARAGEGLGQHDLMMNVVVGEAMDGRATPVFRSDMTMVTFRPYWNVPEAIAVKELVPEFLLHPERMEARSMEIVPDFSLKSVALESNEANLKKVLAGQLKLRQRPSEENALGLFKFSFPNTNNVYLHSTPSKNLFSRDRRDFSHGCIRVQDPLRLAEWVLEENGDWPQDRIEAFAHGDQTKTIPLKRPIPVFILYSTVMADQAGRISFFEDIYGHDRTLQVLLAKGPPYLPVASVPSRP